ncbi:hypothetical protein PUNSTDRAFT_92980, partial [Punctularia strigosozonata HHB-11173 SS5]
MGLPVNNDSSSVQLSRCEDLWYEDGSIILAAEGMGFKVYRMILAQHSSVFADMLALSSPEANVDPMYGCPLVHLSDPAEDLRYLLLTIHDVSFGERIDRAPFKEFAAVAYLAIKYDIPRLRDRIVARLDRWYPQVIISWKHILRPPLSPAEHRTVIDLARQLQKPVLVPFMMLALCQEGVERILQAELEPDDLLIVLRGLSKLQNLQRKNTYRWLFRGPRLCQTKELCASARDNLADAMERSMDSDSKLRLFTPTPDEDEMWDAGLCDVCTEHAVVAHETRSKAIWDRIPAVFSDSGAQ